MQVVKIVKRDEEATATSAPKAVFVLAHGSWHNHSAWDKITPILEAGGFAALTLDLPGAGVHAIAPASLGLRPFDPAAFAAERSPVAGVTRSMLSVWPEAVTCVCVPEIVGCAGNASDQYCD